MKQVLVMEDVTKFYDDIDNMQERKFMEKYSPGNLLAEFKGWVSKQELQSEYQTTFLRKLCDEKQVRKTHQPVTVLILACTDAGSEVKK